MSKAKKKTVRGPQLALPVKNARTPVLNRTRYLEPPTRKDGRPFFALRVKGELLDAFKKHCAKRKVEPTAAVRAYMSRVTGVKLVTDSGGDE